MICRLPIAVVTSFVFAAWLPICGLGQNANGNPGIQQNGALQPAGVQQQQTGQVQNQTQAMPQTVRPPEWVNEPVDPKMKAYLDQLLNYWESSSNGINLYQCSFMRWEYNPLQCNWRNPVNKNLAAHTISKGHIRYASPDKGMYEVSQKWRFSGTKKDNPNEPLYLDVPKEEEKWICDGEFIYEFDYINKRLYDIELPPDARGMGLRNSPLPFVFGAKAADLKARYWIRDITNPQAAKDGQYWLEIWPKRIQDAQTYKKVEVILQKNPFLPISLVIYPINYDPLENPTKMVFEFQDLQINGKLSGIQNFLGWFIKPGKPLGWEREPIKLYGDQAQVPRIGQAPDNK